MNARRKPDDDAAITAPPVATLVATDGGLVPIETVRSGQSIRTPYGPRRITGRRLREKVPIVTIQLSNGIILRLPSHRQLRSQGAWIEASELRRGSPVYMSRTPGPFGSRMNLSLEYSSKFYSENRPTLPSDWSVDLAELVGYFIAKGYISYYKSVNPQNVIILCRPEDPDVQERLGTVIERLFNKAPGFRLNESTPELQILSVDVAGAFNQLLDEGSRVNRIPREVFVAPEPIVAGVLRGYIEGDGVIDAKNGINVPSPHLALLRDIQQLLATFGIPSTVHRATEAEGKRRADYQLRLAGHRARVLFGQRIGLLSERRRSTFDRVLAELQTKAKDSILTLPESLDLATLKPAVYQTWRATNATIPDSLGGFFTAAARGISSISVRRAEWLLGLLPADVQQAQALFLREAIDAAYHEVSVTSVRKGARQSVVELAVEDDLPWMANGIVVRDVGVPLGADGDQVEQSIGEATAPEPVLRVRPTTISSSSRTSRVAAGTLVDTERGWVAVESLREGETIATPEGMRRVIAVGPMAQSASITLRLSNGMSITSHPAQLVRSAGMWVRAGDIVVGDPLYASVAPGAFGSTVNLQLRFTTERPMDVWSKGEVTLPSKWTPELAEFVGYLLAHGTFSTKNGVPEKIALTFDPADEDLLDHFAPIIRRLFARDAAVRRRTSPQLHLFSVDVASAMQQLGVTPRVGERRVPLAVFTAPEPIVAGVLRGYFEGRIRSGGESQMFAASAPNADIARDIQLLLLLFGIASSGRTGGERAVKGGKTRPGLTALYLLGARSKQISAEKIGLLSKRRRQELDTILDQIAIADERFEGRTELLTLTPDCDLRSLKEAVVRERRPADCPPERYRELERLREFISEHISGGSPFITFARASWFVETLPRAILVDHAPFLLEAVERRYVEASVEEVIAGAVEPMVALLVDDDAGEYLAQGIVVRDASDPAV